MANKIVSKFMGVLLIFALLTPALLIPQADASAVGNTVIYHYSDVSDTFRVDMFNAADIDYAEGETIPHAVMITGLTAGTQYGLWINFWRNKPPACGFTDVVQYDSTPRLSPINLLAGSTPIIANGDFDVANNGIGGSLFTKGVLASSVTVGAAQDSGVDRFIPVAFTAETSTVYIYYGLRLAQDGDCGAGSTGANTFPGGSLETRIADGDASGNPVPGITAANMITKAGPLKINPGGIIRSSFGGRKWNDLNNNQIMDSGEPMLAGWTVKVYNCATSASCLTPTLLVTLTTDGVGSFTSTGTAIINNYYKVCEVQQANWENTTPAPGGDTPGAEYCFPVRQVTSTSGTLISYFGNWSPVDLQVTKTTTATYNWNFTQPFMYTIVIRNNGSNGNQFNLLADFTLTDQLPVYLMPVSAATPGAANYAISGGGAGSACDPFPYGTLGATITCTIKPPLNYNNQVTITFYVLFDIYYPEEVTGVDNTANIANYAAGVCPVPNSIGDQVEMVCANNTSTSHIGLNPTVITGAPPVATAENRDILVAWETFSEIDISGFNLYRSTSMNGPLTLIFQTPAKHPGKMIGDIYSYTDLNVQRGIDYTYWLEVRMKNGDLVFLDPTTAQLPPVKVYLPSIRR